MKKVEAIIKPFKLDEVKDALNEIGVQSMTVTEAKGFGHQKSHAELYRGVDYVVDYLPKVKIEIVTPEKKVAEIVKTIQSTAGDHNKGDGKIFVSTVEHAFCISSGKTDEDAL